MFYVDRQRCARNRQLITSRRFCNFLFKSGPYKSVLSIPKIDSTIDCNETAIWYDALSNSNPAAKGSKEVDVPSTGPTVMGAKGDGTKLKPYILLPRKRAMPDLPKYGGRVVMKFEGINWMNQELTEDYLSKVISFPMFTQNRLLVWDSFKCHIVKPPKWP